MKKNIFALLIVLLSVACSGSLAADLTVTNQVQTFLNGIQALVADFIQTNPDQTQVSGKIWLKRDFKKNGKMRLDYDCEGGQRLIAHKDTLVVYDLTDNTESHYNLDYTPAAFILRPKIDLTKDVTVESNRKTFEFIEVVLSPKGDATGQSLTLYFSIYPNGNIKALQEWVVKDPQGNETLVQFVPDTLLVNDVRYVPDALFDFHLK